MQVYHGKGVSGGVAVGRIRVYKKETVQVKCVKTEEEKREIARFRQAKEKTLLQLQKLQEKTAAKVGEQQAAIFATHQMLLADEEYLQFIENVISVQKVNAEYAVLVARDYFAGIFAAMEDEYMQAREADVRDVSERLLAVLTGVSEKEMQMTEPVIVLAEDLTPSETVQLDKKMVLAFVTKGGSVNSHTAILARTMGIPALVGVTITGKDDLDGKWGIVDSVQGVLYVEPDEETMQNTEESRKAEREKRELLKKLKGKDNVTLDGRKIKIHANIGNVTDVEAVADNDGDGIGLFRSEFLYLERDTFPTEEEQFQIYKTVLEKMDGKPVVIRTLDIGADKQCDYFQMEKEENPALGCRAIRICLSRPEIFKTQLRALFRAGIYGNLAIMYPMIISLEEVREIRRIVEEVKEELTNRGVPYGNPSQGIMVETPAAVMISEELAREVDFFSIGTNDLAQYTMAIDRQNPSLDSFYQPHHPALFKMIDMVVKNAHKAGIWVGICGELGADASLTKEFLKMGVDELSVSPGSVLPLRKLIREMDVSSLC